MIIVRNTTDGELKLRFPPMEGEELPVEKTLAVGEEYEIPAKSEADILKYYLSGTEVAKESEEKGESAENETNEAEVTQEEPVEERKTENEPETKEEPKEEPEPITNEDILASEKEELAKERAKLAEEKATLAFDKLVAEGRLVPAQKRAYVALAGLQTNIAVAEDQTETVADLLNEFIQSAPKYSLMNEEGENGDGEDEPELTAEEKKVAETFGNSEEQIKSIKKEM